MGTKYQKTIITVLSFLFIFASGSRAEASPENDRIYQLDNVAWLKAADNADGIFADYLDEQFAQYFKDQSRFVVKPLKGLRDVLDQSSVKYPELILQKPVLKKIALKYRVESLLRTRVYKEASSYRFVIEWVYAPKGDVLATVEFRYIDPGTEDGLLKSELPRTISHNLDELIAKLPFLGQITGVDGETITVNLGHAQNVHPRDTFLLYTLQSLKRHPLLNTIEEWRWKPVGRAQVDQVEESLSFAKVTELEPDQHVIRFQKVREIIPAPPEKAEGEEVKKVDVPRLGWVAANIGIGSYSRDVGISGTTSGRNGSGTLENFELDSQIWLNSRFIAQATLGASVFKYSPNDLSTGSAIGTHYNGSGNDFRIAVGYSLFPMKTVFDTIGWVHLGYKSLHYSLPNQAGDFIGDSSFGSLFIGIGGQFAIQERFMAEMGIDLGVIRGASETDLNYGDASASTDVAFRVAGMYHLDQQFYLRLQIKLSTQSMDFAGGQSISEKNFSINPSLMYYF